MHQELHILVSGRVQGVLFRRATKRVADEYGIVGTSRNLPDGRVEIIAQGDEARLRKLLDWCYRGSLLSHVHGLSYEWRDVTKTYTRFGIERVADDYLLDKKEALKHLAKRAFGRVEKEVEILFPKHVAIIPDGNRRWAKEQGYPSWRGHQEGIERLREIVKILPELDVTHLTFWGFSTENWKRSEQEVSWLMAATKSEFEKLENEFIKSKICFHHFGRKDRLSPEIVTLFDSLESKTKDIGQKHFAIALDYGGRDEILRAVEKIKGTKEITDEENFSNALDTQGFPDVDLIIRTSGEQRLSGIFPWQGVYAELYFTPLHFPDFTPGELKLAIEDYTLRQRRFGQ
ncbi:di-trans,poly-cis-decaprenylcistransferase [Candidatus Nomurabacteria bacterium]|jgi:undecaprenyl diphosphate synthase|nr:MAG: di-trans,poly-cis-decaprenylcistransferase [Candidatus Nomurabacteria bacterium]